MNNILVIDDDPEILDAVDVLLTTRGLKVKTESCWERTFNEIESFEPDIILLDIDLGNEDGRIICQQLKSSVSSSHIPVILLSGIMGISSKLGDCLNDDFISKPFDPQVLFDKIEYFLFKISKSKNFEKDNEMLQMMESGSLVSFDYLYDKYAASLFGYILSVIKEKQQSETILIKVFTELATNPQNNKKESLLLKCIRIANRSMMETTQYERKSFIALFNNYKEIKNN